MNKIKKWIENQEDVGICLINSVVSNNECFEFIFKKENSNIELYLSYNNEKIQTIATNNDVIYEIYSLFTIGDDLVIQGKDIQYNIYDREMLDIINTHQITININQTIYSAGIPNQHRYMNLLKIYDKENYEAYNHKNIRNRALNGLTQEEYEETDDYCWGGATMEEIEAHPERYNGRYNQGIFKRCAYWQTM